MEGVIRCKRCEGCGMIEHPYWEKLYASVSRDEYQSMSAQQCLDWMIEHGLVDGTETIAPPEEIPCPECDGAGFIKHNLPSWMEAQRAELAEIREELIGACGSRDLMALQAEALTVIAETLIEIRMALTGNGRR